MRLPFRRPRKHGARATGSRVLSCSSLLMPASPAGSRTPAVGPRPDRPRTRATWRSRRTGTRQVRKHGRIANIYEPRWIAGALLGGAVAVWIVGNISTSPSAFAFLLFVGITNGSIYALIALGFTLSYTSIGLINLPHGYVFMTGAVLSAHLLDTAGVDESASFLRNLPAMLIVLLIVMCVCGLLSALIEIVAYRPLSNAPRLSRLVTSIGVLFILNNIIIVWTGSKPVAVPDLLPKGDVFTVVGVTYTWDKLIVLSSMVLVLASLYFALQRTRFGKSIRAAIQDSIGAQLVGVNVARTVTLAFFLAGALAGAGGQLYVLYFTNVSWDQALRLTLIAFTAVVVGGIESLIGAVIGAMIIGITESFVNGFEWYSPGSDWTESVVLSVLIILLVLRPQGLLGEEPQPG
jgi:branched-chain amino acid transport system permease protein